MTTTRKGEQEYVVHAAAAVFPMLADAELEALADDVKKHGLVHPVELVRGQVVDGRNRLAACRRAGVKPTYRDLSETLPTDADVVRHVASANLARRHLTTAQRAAIAADLAGLELGANQHRKPRGPKDREPPSSAKEAPPNGGPSTAEAAKLLGVSTRSVERAKALKRSDPVRHEAVKAGTAKPKPKAARPTSTKPAAAPAQVAASLPIRETAPPWYETLCREVLALAQAAMKANRVPAAEIIGALDDVAAKLEDEGA